MLLGIILFAIGIYILYLIQKKGGIEGQKSNLYLFGALAALFIGSYFLFSDFSFELLKRRVIGLLLFMFGFWLSFLFPGDEYQPEGMGNLGLFVGLIILIGGIWMMFF